VSRGGYSISNEVVTDSISGVVTPVPGVFRDYAMISIRTPDTGVTTTRWNRSKIRMPKR
jgi:hypothetical protein